MGQLSWYRTIETQLHSALHARLHWLTKDYTPIESPSDGHTQLSSRSLGKLLDYACGTGLVSKALWQNFDCVRAIDISPEIVTAYNAHFASSGVAASRVCAEAGDLVGYESEPYLLRNQERSEWCDFDVVIAGFCFRHFDDEKLAMQRLVQRLRNGGVLCVFDVVLSEQSSKKRERPKHSFDVVKVSGFSEETMRALLCGAGLCKIVFEVLDESIVVGGDQRRQVFIARGQRC
jgi:SAM-dependent methyltransferase